MLNKEIEKAIKRYKPIETRMRSHKKIKIDEASSKDHSKKVTEYNIILQIISIINDNINIVSATECPDFELQHNDISVGAELVSLVKANKDIANLDKMNRVVGNLLSTKFPDHKYLIRYTLHKNITFKDINKNILVDILSTAINSTRFERYGKINITDNNYIRSIDYMKGSALSLFRYEGVVYLNDVTSEQVNNIVNIKNEKLKDYNKSYAEQWLFITIPVGGMYGDLDLPDDVSNIINNLVENNFDRIYLSCITRVRQIK